VIVLASASPRRREILELLRVPFSVIPSDVDETMAAGEGALAYAARIARAKAAEIAARHTPETFVLGADTVVVVDDEVLGKPQSDVDACAMISRLAGRWHQVATAVCLVHGARVAEELTVTTRVRFRALEPEAIARYVASGEGRDKAGAYAAQGLGAGLVAEIEGSFFNVIGLPAAETVDLLVRAGALARWP